MQSLPASSILFSLFMEAESSFQVFLAQLMIKEGTEQIALRDPETEKLDKLIPMKPACYYSISRWISGFRSGLQLH